MFMIKPSNFGEKKETERPMAKDIKQSSTPFALKIWGSGNLKPTLLSGGGGEENENTRM